MYAKLIPEQNNDNNKPNDVINNNELEEQNVQNEQNDHLDEQNNIDDLSKLIKDIPLNNLNDYYDIETNLFKKRIEKLNLKFYWIYESVLGEDNNSNIIYPYNKLFLILFKEISLYIEEILRLNKQLNLKNKNEKYYLNKLNYYKEKEKDYLLSKQIVKNLERTIKTLEKNNDKLKNDLEKSNKRLFNSNVSPSNLNSNFISWKHSVSNSKINFFNNSNNKCYNINFTEQGSVMSSGSNKLSHRTIFNQKTKSKEKTGNLNTNNRINSTSSIYTKTTNISSGNNNKDIIFISINQCDDEINNLNIIENLLMKYYENNKKKKMRNKNNFQSYKLFSQDKLNINNQRNINSYRKNLYVDKNIKKSNKSLDFKNIIANSNKI